MPLIPDLNPVPGKVDPVAPSLGAAMAPGRALQQVGSGITRVGEEIGAFQLRVAQARDQGIKSSASIAVQQAVAEHEKFRIENPDETKWEADLTERMGKVRDQFSKEQLSPLGRQELDAQFGSWEATYKGRTMVDASKQTMQRARQALTNEVRARQDAGDFDGAEKRIKEATGTVYLPEEADADIVENNRLRKAHDTKRAMDLSLAEIDQDPFAVREKYSSAKPPEGEDPVEWSQKRDHFRARLAREQNGIIDSIRDGMASGKITRPDQLDEWQDELGPAAVATIKSEMAKSAEEGRKDAVKSSPYQARIIGAATAAIEELDPKDIEGRIRVEGFIRDIEPGPTKESLTSELRRKIDGKPEDYSSLSRAKAIANNALRNGYFGPFKSSTPQSTSDVIGDDYLLDRAKLASLGIPEDWVDKVTSKDIKNTDERVRVFAEAMKARDPKKATADDYVTRSAMAIVQRQNDVPRTDAEIKAQMKSSWDALKKHGAMIKTLTEWSKAHPDGDVEAEMIRMLGEVESDKFLNSLNVDQYWGDQFQADPSGDPTVPDLPSGYGGTNTDLLPNP